MASIWRGILAVLGGALVHLSLGTIYTYGNMTPYFTSYIRSYSSPSDVRYTTSIWVFAITAGSQGAFMFVGGFISNHLGPRWAALIGGWTSSLGVVLTSLTIKWSFYGCLLTYGVMYGAGIGIAYAPPLACAMKWMPNHKGLVNGIVVAGFGLGAFIFDQVQTSFINPHNLSPDLPGPAGSNEKYFSKDKAGDVLDRVPSCFLLLGGCYAGLQLIGALLLVDPPKTEEAHHPEDRTSLINKEDLDTDQSEKEEDALVVPHSQEVESVHPKQMLKTKSFYILWFMFLFQGQGVLFISTLYKTFGQTFLKDDHFLALVGSFSSIFNAGGRIMWGKFADRFSFRITMIVLCTCMIALMMTLIAAPRGGKVIYAVWICAIFLTFSGNFALFPTAIAKSFGPRYVAVNFGILFTSQAVTGLLGAILTTSLNDLLGYFGMFCLVSGFTLLALILAFIFNVRRPDGRHI